MGLQSWLFGSKFLSVNPNLYITRYNVLHKPMTSCCLSTFRRKKLFSKHKLNGLLQCYPVYRQNRYHTELGKRQLHTESHTPISPSHTKRTSVIIHSVHRDRFLIVKRLNSNTYFRRMNYDKEEEEKVIKSITEIKKVVERNINDVKKMVEKSIDAIKKQTNRESPSSNTTTKTDPSSDNESKPPEIKFSSLNSKKKFILNDITSNIVYCRRMNQKSRNRFSNNYRIIRCITTNSSGKSVQNFLQSGPVRKIKRQSFIEKLSEKILEKRALAMCTPETRNLCYAGKDDVNRSGLYETLKERKGISTAEEGSTRKSKSVETVDSNRANKEDVLPKLKGWTFYEYGKFIMSQKNPIRPRSETMLQSEKFWQQLGKIAVSKRNNYIIKNSVAPIIMDDLLEVPSKDTADRIRTAKVKSSTRPDPTVKHKYPVFKRAKSTISRNQPMDFEQMPKKDGPISTKAAPEALQHEQVVKELEATPVIKTAKSTVSNNQPMDFDQMPKKDGPISTKAAPEALQHEQVVKELEATPVIKTAKSTVSNNQPMDFDQMPKKDGPISTKASPEALQHDQVVKELEATPREEPEKEITSEDKKEVNLNSETANPEQPSDMKESAKIVNMVVATPPLYEIEEQVPRPLLHPPELQMNSAVSSLGKQLPIPESPPRPMEPDQTVLTATSAPTNFYEQRTEMNNSSPKKINNESDLNAFQTSETMSGTTELLHSLLRGAHTIIDMGKANANNFLIYLKENKAKNMAKEPSPNPQNDQDSRQDTYPHALHNKKNNFLNFLAALGFLVYLTYVPHNLFVMPEDAYEEDEIEEN